MNNKRGRNMKEYETLDIRIYVLDGEIDMLSASIGTDNDNDGEDLEDWFD